jgi:hypothetical protein
MSVLRTDGLKMFGTDFCVLRLLSVFGRILKMGNLQAYLVVSASSCYCTVCTVRLHTENSASYTHSVFKYFVELLQEPAIISLYYINWFL